MKNGGDNGNGGGGGGDEALTAAVPNDDAGDGGGGGGANVISHKNASRPTPTRSLPEMAASVQRTVAPGGNGLGKEAQPSELYTLRSTCQKPHATRGGIFTSEAGGGGEGGEGDPARPDDAAVEDKEDVEGDSQPAARLIRRAAAPPSARAAVKTMGVDRFLSTTSSPSPSPPAPEEEAPPWRRSSSVVDPSCSERSDKLNILKCEKKIETKPFLIQTNFLSHQILLR